MATVSKQDSASIARQLSVGASALIAQIPALDAAVESQAQEALAAALAAEEAIDEFAVACSERGVNAGDLFAKNIEERVKSADLAVLRDLSIDSSAASDAARAAKDAFAVAVKDAMAEPSVMREIGRLYDQAAQRLEELAESSGRLVTELSQLDGMIRPSLGDSLRLAGDSSQVVHHDVQRDQPERIVARARARARTLAELGDRDG